MEIDNLAVTLERRTGFGSRGQAIQVMSNCFKVKSMPKDIVQMYDVSFSDDRVKEKRIIIKYCLDVQRIMGPAGAGAVYDGNKILYVPGAVIPEINHSLSESVARGRPPRQGQEPTKNLTITIKHARPVDIGKLAAFMAGQGANDESVQDAVNALNIALRMDPFSAHPSRKQSFYPRPDPKDTSQYRLLSGALEVWVGYFLSIRPGIGNMIMNFDRVAGTFKQGGDPVAVLLRLTGRKDPRDLYLGRAPGDVRVGVLRFLKGLTVAFRFGRPDAVYKIRKASKESADEFKFETEPGVQTNVREYIEKKYQIRLQHPHLPCVQLTKIAWYPLELVRILPGTQFFGKLKADQINEMLKFTTLSPQHKLASLRSGLQKLALQNSSPTLNAWNLNVEDHPMRVAARLLPPPTVTYGGAAVHMPQPGAWDVRDKRMTRPAETIKQWAVVIFAETRDFPLEAAQQSITNLVKACRNYGINFMVDRPTITHVGHQLGPDVRKALVDCCKKAGFGRDNPPQLVVTYVRDKTSPQYSYIKHTGDVALGFATQNMLIQKMQKAGAQYYANVALKINVKLSGTNQSIQGGLPGFLKTPTMVFGADVTHPAPGSLLPSIAAVVASHDQNALEYTTAVRVQNSREEIIVDLQDIAMALIKNYRKKTTRAPDRLIFYRDGVSEGQFDEVCRTEVAAIKRACASLPNYKPTLTYIICGKRHHIRLFPMQKEEGDRSGNVKAGTIVDRDITHPYYKDFYLMSHAGLLGTSRPTHYTVLLDEAKLGPDQLQATTYYLAYLYPRATRSVSIAAPAYFAHHVAARARAHVNDHDDQSETSSNSPEAQDAARQAKLERAQTSLNTSHASLSGVHVNLTGTMYFM